MLSFQKIRNWARGYAYILFGISAVAAIGLSLAVGLFTSYNRILDSSYSALQRLAVVTEHHSIGVIQSANQILESTIHDLNRLARFGQDNPLEIQRTLNTNVIGQNTVHDIGLADANGYLLYTSFNRLAEPIFVGDREWFRVPREQETAGLHISATMQGRVGGNRILPVSRRMTDSDGNFNGVVVAMIKPEMLRDMFKGLIISGDATITLSRRDGMMLVREPGFDPARANIINSPLFRDHVPRAPVGSYRIVTDIEAVDRLVTYRVSDQLPIVVSLAFTVSDLLRTWYADLFWYVGASSLCALAIMGFSIKLHLGLRQQQQTEEQLRQSQKMEALGQLTGGIAHDFNNRLAATMTNLELIGDKVAHDPAAQASLDAAMRSVVRAADLTNQLLAFSRPRPRNPQSVELNAVIEGMKDLAHRTLGEKVQVRLDLQPDVGVVIVDPAQLENALLNLMINARDAMPQGGLLTIRTRSVTVTEEGSARLSELAPGSYALVTVADTGVGMPPEIRKRVFEPFFTTKDPGKGTGLGLSMVYGFARQSLGHVEIESHPGQGTLVALYLPQSMDRLTAQGIVPVTAATSSSDGSSVGGTVLVVDDDDDVRFPVAITLRGLGYAVRTAVDGQTALRILDEGAKVDIMLTDLGLPQGMNGVELSRQALQRRPELKVVYMSAYAEAMAEARRGDIEFLQKPFKKIELASRLNAALGRPAST